MYRLREGLVVETLYGGVSPWNSKDVQTLYGMLAMLAAKAKRNELLSVVGLGGPICSGELVYIRGHAGLYVSAKSEGVVACNASERGSDEEFFVMSNTRIGALQKSDVVTLEVANSGCDHLLLSVDDDGQTRASPSGSSGEQNFKIVMRSREGALESGAPVFLRALPSRRLVELRGEAMATGVSTPTPGTRQRFFLEKIIPPAAVPPQSEERDLSLEDQAWLLLRGVQHAVVQKQHLAELLSGPKTPAPELLSAFATQWESEWRSAGAQAHLNSFAGGSEARKAATPALGGSPTKVGSAAAAAATPPPTENEALMRIRRLVLGNTVSPTERENGDLFVSALRSFFADALQVSQLEANNVMRIVEAFAAALVADASFVASFTASMLPEEQRKAYRTPEEILFGLAYTAMMLNTDFHSQQVTASQKTWDQKKFVSAGKDCGVVGGLMTHIFRRITENEL
jgi:hypothetical protein